MGSGMAVLLLALVHLLGGRLSGARVIGRQRWLSVAGGVAVAYVFVHLLPELAVRSEVVAASFRVEEAIFAVALAGLVAFYGLERWARASRRDREPDRGEPCTPPAVFWLHVASFSIYNAIVGYLLVDPESRLALFTGAMALHFMVNDASLRRHHRHRYDRWGRWILSASILVGFGVARLLPVGDLAFALLLAFLGGGVVLNTLKEEVPEERDSRFRSFTAGAVGYTALLLLLG